LDEKEAPNHGIRYPGNNSDQNKDGKGKKKERDDFGPSDYDFLQGDRKKGGFVTWGGKRSTGF